MTLEEAKAHFTKLAQDSGMDAESTKTVLQAMENEKFRTGLAAGYKRHDEYSREMDSVRAEKQRLKDWYEKEELPKYQVYQAGAEELRKYKEAYGNLDDGGLNNGGNGNGNGNGRGNGHGMTQEQLDKYLEDKLKQRDSAYVGLTKTAVRISSDYTKRFQDTLDVDAVEELALKKGLPLDQAYKEYIAPKEQAATEARHKAEIEAAKAEAVRDFTSRMKLPIDSKPHEAHPFFERKGPEAGKTEADMDRASKEEFMKGWNDYNAADQKTAAG